MANVKLTAAALHESPLRNGSITLRGVLDVHHLRNLKFDEYQREAPSLSRQNDLVAALRAGNTLPDIEVGMRGQRVRSNGEDWFLLDDCYVIDGQTRVLSCIAANQQYPDLPVFLGATVHFGTERVWERERFHVLNANRLRISPNVLLKNMRDDHRSVGIIYNLSHGSNGVFALAGKISWGQYMKRGTLSTALNVMKMSGRLHSHISSGQSTSIKDLARQLDVLVDRITPSMYRDNIRQYFEVLDDIWGVRNVHYREQALWLSGNFMDGLAKVFSRHEVFWQGVNEQKLFVASDWRRKLKSFPINDPTIRPITTAAGAARLMLYNNLIDHLNTGKRGKRLKPRQYIEEEDNIPEPMSEAAE